MPKARYKSVTPRFRVVEELVHIEPRGNWDYPHTLQKCSYFYCSL
jgi:hypothetical protein